MKNRENRTEEDLDVEFMDAFYELHAAGQISPELPAIGERITDSRASEMTKRHGLLYRAGIRLHFIDITKELETTLRRLENNGSLKSDLEAVTLANMYDRLPTRLVSLPSAG